MKKEYAISYGRTYIEHIIKNNYIFSPLFLNVHLVKIVFVGNKRVPSFLADMKSIAGFTFMFRCCISNFPALLSSLKQEKKKKNHLDLHIVLMN